HAGHLPQQLGPLLEAVGDRPGQGGDPLQRWRQVAGRQAGVAVEGEQPLAAGPAEVVGAAVADGPHQAQGGADAVRVELGGAPAGGGGYRGAAVSVFFPAKCPSRALAAIRWAMGRVLYSFAPKRGASVVGGRSCRRSLI